MGLTILNGSQWGDEGKGRIVDNLIVNGDVSYVIRFQGGPNAGHTVQVGDEIYILRCLPSGAVSGTYCAIAQNVVLDPRVLMEEIRGLKNRGIEVKLDIDPRTNIIMPWHQWMDGAEELYRGNDKIGTTLKGIGPAYEDARRGIKLQDMMNKHSFYYKFDKLFQRYENIITKAFNYSIRDIIDEFDLPDKKTYKNSIFYDYFELGKLLKPYMKNVSEETMRRLNDKENVLVEGAQGTHLDRDFGINPYVTSSQTIATAAYPAIGLPLSVAYSTNVLGVVKAYTTRVGEGPMRTEQKNKIGAYLAEKGHEIGTVTQRPRRCGWLDLDQIVKSHELNGYTSLAITKLDVLCGLDTLKIAYGTLKGINTPNYMEFEGFDFDSDKIKTQKDLPKEARDYLSFIEGVLAVPIRFVTFGPEREQIIYNF